MNVSLGSTTELNKLIYPGAKLVSEKSVVANGTWTDIQNIVEKLD